MKKLFPARFPSKPCGRADAQTCFAGRGVAAAAMRLVFGVALCLLLLVPAVLASCDGAQYEYSSRRSYLVIDNSVHQDPTLASAMTPYSGVFTAITVVNNGGAQYFKFTSNQGQTTQSIFNAIDQRRTIVLGMNQGLIVGYTVWADLTFYAYDRECPNCFEPEAIPVRSKALQMSSSGIATCQTCHRKYDLNSGGIIVEGDKGEKLVRYRAGTTGAYGVLNVN